MFVTNIRGKSDTSLHKLREYTFMLKTYETRTRGGEIQINLWTGEETESFERYFIENF